MTRFDLSEHDRQIKGQNKRSVGVRLNVRYLSRLDVPTDYHRSRAIAEVQRRLVLSKAHPGRWLNIYNVTVTRRGIFFVDVEVGGELLEREPTPTPEEQAEFEAGPAATRLWQRSLAEPRGFVADSYYVLLATSQRDAENWLSKHRLYEGKLAVIYTSRPEAAHGRIVRSVYATADVYNVEGAAELIRIMHDNILRSSGLFLEAPMAELPPSDK